MKNIAIIPVRTGSKRLAKKNTRQFFGMPLFLHTVDHAVQTGLFDKIHVSTESEEVAEECAKFGVAVDFMRPDSLAQDNSTLQQVCEYVIQEYESLGDAYDHFCLLWPTSPMRTQQDIRAAYELLDENTDAVVGVASYDLPVFCAQKIDGAGNLEPLFPDMLRLQSQQMPSVVCDNGSLCWVKISAFKEHKTWLPPKLKGYQMPKHRSADIDTEEDWSAAQYLYKKHILKTIA